MGKLEGYELFLPLVERYDASKSYLCDDWTMNLFGFFIDNGDVFFLSVCMWVSMEI